MLLVTQKDCLSERGEGSVHVGVQLVLKAEQKIMLFLDLLDEFVPLHHFMQSRGIIIKIRFV